MFEYIEYIGKAFEKINVTRQLSDTLVQHNNKLFSGIRMTTKSVSSFVKGVWHGYSYEKKQSIRCYTNNQLNGYAITKSFTENQFDFAVYDMGVPIEIYSFGKVLESKFIISFGKDQDNFDEMLGEGNIVTKIKEFENELKDSNEYTEENLRTLLNTLAPELGVNITYQKALRGEWAYTRKKRMEQGYYENDNDFLPYYYQQNEMRTKVIKEDRLPETVKYIAGTDVAYNDLEMKMVGGIVVLDAQTFEIVDQATHEMEVTFPYVPGLFSFREIPPILEAFKKLTIKPDLIICDAQGIAHPKNVGMATHLGIELDIPTIGCAKKRLIGTYDKKILGTNRGDSQPLIYDGKEVGKALRTQDNTKEMFVSIGHKISIDTACKWVLKLSTKFRLPETTRAADKIVNDILKNRTEIDFFSDEDDE